MVRVKETSSKSGTVDLGHGAEAEVQVHAGFTDFHATMLLEDGRMLKFFVRNGAANRGVEPIVIVELCEEGSSVGPEIFRRWLKQDDEVQSPS